MLNLMPNLDNTVTKKIVGLARQAAVLAAERARRDSLPDEYVVEAFAYWISDDGIETPCHIIPYGHVHLSISFSVYTADGSTLISTGGCYPAPESMDPEKAAAEILSDSGDNLFSAVFRLAVSCGQLGWPMEPERKATYRYSDEDIPVIVSPLYRIPVQR